MAGKKQQAGEEHTNMQVYMVVRGQAPTTLAGVPRVQLPLSGWRLVAAAMMPLARARVAATASRRSGARTKGEIRRSKLLADMAEIVPCLSRPA